MKKFIPFAVLSALFFTLVSCSDLFNRNETGIGSVTFSVDLSALKNHSVSSYSGTARDASSGNGYTLYAFLCSPDFVSYGQKQMQTLISKNEISESDFSAAAAVKGVIGYKQQPVTDTSIPVLVQFDKIDAGTEYFVILAVTSGSSILYYGVSPDEMLSKGYLCSGEYNEVKSGTNEINITMNKNTAEYGFFGFSNGKTALYVGSPCGILYYWYMTIGGNVNKDEVDKSVTIDKITDDTNAQCYKITHTAAASNEPWDAWICSEANWNFKSGTNYKITFDMKADEKCAAPVEITDTFRSENGAMVLETITTQWQTYTINTGCWEGDWFGYMNCCVGAITKDKSIYIKNLRVESTTDKFPVCMTYSSTNDPAAVTALPAADGSVVCSFNYGTDAGNPWSQIAKTNGLKMTQDGALYKFTAIVKSSVSTTNFCSSVHCINQSYETGYKNNVSLKADTPQSFTWYTPCYLLHGEDYRFGDIEFALGATGTLTVSNVKTEVTTMDAVKDSYIPYITGTSTDWKWTKMTAAADGGYESKFDIPAGETKTVQIVLTDPTNPGWDDALLLRKIIIANKSSLNMEPAADKDDVPLINNSSAVKYCRIKLTNTFRIIVEDTSAL